MRTNIRCVLKEVQLDQSFLRMVLMNAKTRRNRNSYVSEEQQCRPIERLLVHRWGSNVSAVGMSFSGLC